MFQAIAYQISHTFLVLNKHASWYLKLLLDDFTRIYIYNLELHSHRKNNSSFQVKRVTDKYCNG